MSMKNLVLLAIVLVLVVALSGCTVTKESVQASNERIEAEYKSADGFTYTIDEIIVVDGLFAGSQRYAEVIKKPDKKKTMLISKVKPPEGTYSLFSGMTIITPFGCNGNTGYWRVTPALMTVGSYVGWPTGEASYCGEQIAAEWGKWKIPMMITDTENFEVTTSEVDWEGGTKAIKAVVNVSEKFKSISSGSWDGLVITYWFQPHDLAILRDEATAITRVCKPSVAEGGESNDCKSARITITRIYSHFGFNIINVPDSEFAVNPADFPGVTFEYETINYGQGVAVEITG